MTPTHVLVTRPRPEGDELADALERAGIAAVRMPAFRFEPSGVTIGPDEAWRAADSRLLLFTSPRAVAFGLPATGALLRVGGIPVSIGPATSRALASHGLEAVQAPGPPWDSETLLEHLAKRFEPGAVVILAAPGGREALQRGLEQAGWNVRMAPVYARVPVEPAREQVERLEQAGHLASVWTSGNALRHILPALTGRARERVLAGIALVVSERLATLAQAQGFADVRVAEGPGNAELLESLQRLEV